MTKKNLTYMDFAYDEMQYLTAAYSKGMRFNAMVSQAQRICECFLKQVITRSLVNNNEVMMSHNLRSLYDYVESLGIDIRPIRAEIMMLNNYYTHTRYPGRDAFLASSEDIDASYKALLSVATYIQKEILNA